MGFGDIAWENAKFSFRLLDSMDYICFCLVNLMATLKSKELSRKKYCFDPDLKSYVFHLGLIFFI